MPADAFSLARRATALLQAAQPLPADLRTWLAAGLQAYVDGRDLLAALGLRAAPSRRDPRTRDRHEQRNAALADLMALAEGSAHKRAECVIAWWEAYRDGYPVPEPARPPLASLAELRVTVPTDARHLCRVASEARSRRESSHPA